MTGGSNQMIFKDPFQPKQWLYDSILVSYGSALLQKLQKVAITEVAQSAAIKVAEMKQTMKNCRVTSEYWLGTQKNGRWKQIKKG